MATPADHSSDRASSNEKVEFGVDVWESVPAPPSKADDAGSCPWRRLRLKRAVCCPVVVATGVVESDSAANCLVGTAAWKMEDHPEARRRSCAAADRAGDRWVSEMR